MTPGRMPAHPPGDYPGPVRLRSPAIPWGKPDKDTAEGVCRSIQRLMPPTVILWAPGQRKLQRILRQSHVQLADIDDINALVENNSGYTLADRRPPVDPELLQEYGDFTRRLLQRLGFQTEHTT